MSHRITHDLRDVAMKRGWNSQQASYRITYTALEGWQDAISASSITMNK